MKASDVFIVVISFGCISRFTFACKTAGSDSLSFNFQADVSGIQGDKSDNSDNSDNKMLMVFIKQTSEGPVQESINDASSIDFNMISLNVLALLHVENEEDKVKEEIVDDGSTKADMVGCVDIVQRMRLETLDIRSTIKSNGSLTWKKLGKDIFINANLHVTFLEFIELNRHAPAEENPLQSFQIFLIW